jgi:predicted HAD superfamily Cof-like phosphohydrolase
MNKKIKFDEGDDLQIKSILESATDIKLSSKSWNVPFVNEVEEFNETFGKPNNYIPTIGEKKEWMFVYDFIQEELAEYKEACEKGDIIGVLDALCDITYVSLGNGAMLHGLKGHIWKAYQEVQASNMSKACKTEEEAIETCKSECERIGEATHFEKVGKYYIVYRTRDRKVLKSINYFPPNLTQFFDKEDLK